MSSGRVVSAVLLDDLTVALNERSDRECFDVRWSLRDLRTGTRIDRCGAVQQWSASTRKVSVALAAMHHLHKRGSDLDQPRTYRPEMGQGVQSGTFKYMSPGFSFTLRDAIANMLITSDNVCTGVVFDALADNERDSIRLINDYCRGIGMRGTVHRHRWLDTRDVEWFHTDEGMTVTTANDQVDLLSAVATGAGDDAAAGTLGVTAAHCATILDLMSCEEDLDGIGMYLPAGTRVASKSGRDARGRGHIAVVFDSLGAASFAMAVYTDWVPTELLDGKPGRAQAQEVIAELLLIAYEALIDGQPGAGALLPPAQYPHGGEVHWYLRDQRGARGHGTHNAVELPGAARLFAAATALAVAARGDLDLTDLTTLTAAHAAASRSGVLRYLGSDNKLRLIDALAQISISGDDIGFALLDQAFTTRGLDLVEEMGHVAEASGLESTSFVRREPGPGLGSVAVTSTARDLAEFFHEVVQCCEGSTDDPWLGPDDATLLLAHCSSTDPESGLVDYLPGYGPHILDVPHLLVDGGPAEPGQPGTWFDAGTAQRNDGSRYVAAMICPDVPAHVGRINGGAHARKLIAEFGRSAWVD